MRRRFPLRAVLTAAATALVTAAALGATATTAGATTARASTWPGSGALPAHVFAPYFETYDTTDGGLAALSQAVRGQVPVPGVPADRARPARARPTGTATPRSRSPPSTFGADIAAIQAPRRQRHPVVRRLHRGHHRHRNRRQLHQRRRRSPQVFESLITTYHVPRIDLDVEADSLTNTAGINRRNEAIAQTEAWAAAHHRSIQFSYTLPTFPTGLTAAGLAVLQNAVADGARISVVNLLTFDYYFGTEQDMVADTETAGGGPGQPAADAVPGRQRAPALAHGRRHRDARHRRLRPGRDVLDRPTRSPILHWAQQPGLGLAVLLGAAARQRRLPGHQGRGQLLRRDPAGLVLQPHLRALHPAVTPAEAARSPWQHGDQPR